MLMGADIDCKIELLRSANLALAGLYEPGDLRCYPWLNEELSRIEEEAGDLDYQELGSRLRALYLRFRAVKRDSNTGRASAHDPSEAGSEATRERSDMPIEFQVKEDVQPVREGQHDAMIHDIGERESKFSDSKYDTYLAITYEITDGKDAGRTLFKGYTPVLSSKSHLGQLWRRIKGNLPVGQTIDVEELIGERVQIIVAHEVGDDGDVRVRISEVFAPLEEEDEDAAHERELAEAVS